MVAESNASQLPKLKVECDILLSQLVNYQAFVYEYNTLQSIIIIHNIVTT